jgi:hypothetical protein
MKAEISPTAVSGGGALSVVTATGATPTSNRRRD